MKIYTETHSHRHDVQTQTNFVRIFFSVETAQREQPVHDNMQMHYKSDKHLCTDMLHICHFQKHISWTIFIEQNVQTFFFQFHLYLDLY